MEQYGSIEERVARGVEYLDSVKPLWRMDIDTEKLNMMSANDCILGQVFGNFYNYADVWLQDHGYSTASMMDCGKWGEFAFLHGFDVPTDDFWTELEEEWIKHLIVSPPVLEEC